MVHLNVDMCQNYTSKNTEARTCQFQRAKLPATTSDMMTYATLKNEAVCLQGNSKTLMLPSHFASSLISFLIFFREKISILYDMTDRLFDVIMYVL